MQQTNTELAESLQQFVTIWKMIGRPFPLVDQTDREIHGMHAGALTFSARQRDHLRAVAI
jgi:hypothetical protein